MRPTILTCTVMVAVMAIAACGGGGDDPPVTDTPDATPPMTTPPEEPPLAMGDPAIHLNITTTDGDHTFVGGGTTGVMPQGRVTGTYPTRISHEGIDVYSGTVPVGASRDRIAAVLADEARHTDGRLERFGTTPPVIRVVPGTEDQHWRDLVLAVGLINDALPAHWQLTLSRETNALPTPASGEIVVGFAPADEWRQGACDNTGVGCTRTRGSGEGEIAGAAVWIDAEALAQQTGDRSASDQRRVRMHMLARGLLQALGRSSSGDGTDTIVHAGADVHLQIDVLSQLDRDALLAVYDRLAVGTAPGEIYDALGPWETTADVMVGFFSSGNDEESVFGVTRRNGLVQPWATGRTPEAALADNPGLGGTAGWYGRLLGYTPEGAAVGATAHMTVTLATLSGQIEFTGMEQWPDVPDAVGTGTTWGDGDLRYPVQVLGNSFLGTGNGGDQGSVEGAFFGRAHEAMGGTLRRDDLTAAFGGAG